MDSERKGLNMIAIAKGAALLLLAFALTEDCLVGGGNPTEGTSVLAPTIENVGTTTGTNGTGCDGCVVNVMVKITWWSFGVGKYTVNGVTSSIDPVQPGMTTLIETKLDLSCNSTKSVTAFVPDVANTESSIEWTCSTCR
jgi:hypothetical protein